MYPSALKKQGEEINMHVLVGNYSFKGWLKPREIQKSHSTEADVVKLKIGILLVFLWTPKIFALGTVSGKI